MDNIESEKQITRMSAYIMQEATEKVNEINLKTEQERDRQLTLLGIEGKREIDAEYERMMKDLNKKKRVMKAKASQKELVRKFQTRDKLLDTLLDEARAQLAGVAKSGEYENMCKQLIVQGLVKLMETDVKVRCRKADVQMITKLIPSAAQEYQKLFKEQCEMDMKANIRVDDARFLRDDSSGGVILMGHGNKIVCDNTLDTRLKLCFEDLKPVVRGCLFPSSMAK